MSSLTVLPHHCIFCNSNFKSGPALFYHQKICQKKLHVIQNRINGLQTTDPQVSTGSPVLPIAPASPAPAPAPSPAAEVPYANPTHVHEADSVEDPVVDQQFDFGFEIAKWATLAVQRRGLPDKDVQTLLDIINKAKEINKLDTLPYDSLTSFKQYRKSLSFKDNEDEGWNVIRIEVTSEHVEGLEEPFSANFYFRDVLKWLTTEFSNAEYKNTGDGESFVLEAKEVVNAAGKRVYNKPEQCDAWIDLQRQLRRTKEFKDAVIAALQLYSDKTLLNRKGLQCHSVKITLLNIPFSRRIFCLATIAYLSPLSEKPNNLSDEKWRLVKLSYMHLALEHLLKPLKEAGATGLQLKDPWGQERTVVPQLLSYVMDDPESKDVFCITRNACEACRVGVDNFMEITKVYSVRDEKKQVVGYERATATGRGALSATDRRKLCTERRIVPVRSALWGFRNQDTMRAGSIMLILAFEAMHNEDLGIFLYIIDNMREYLIQKKGMSKIAANRLLKTLNQRMASMPRTGT